MNKRKFRRLVIVSCLTVGAYLFGAYSYPRDLWPLGALRRAIPHQTPMSPIRGSFDAMGRLIAFPAKTKVDCPTQTADTAVLLVIGQSNAANHAEQRITTRFPGRALNYFEGNCYDAASPLLGATGGPGRVRDAAGRRFDRERRLHHGDHCRSRNRRYDNLPLGTRRRC